MAIMRRTLLPCDTLRWVIFIYIAFSPAVVWFVELLALIPTSMDFCNGEKESIIDVCKNCEKKKRVTQVSRAGEETIAYRMRL